MKKLLLAIAIICTLSGATLGATSEDMSVYVRQDVYNSDMRNINDKLNSILEELRAQNLKHKAKLSIN